MRCALLVAVIVALAGCVGATQVRIDADNGLVINEFSIDPPEVEGGRPFRIFLEVENVGGTTARSVKALLFGASWLPQGAPEKWGDRIIGPPDLLTNSPGGTLAAFWDASDLGFAPALPEGVVHTFTLTGRVTYDYSTSAVANILLFNEEEFLRIRKLGEPLEAAIDVSNTNAPIKVAVEGTAPIVVRDPTFDQLPAEEVFYRIMFINAGSGIPITEGTDASGRQREITGLVGGRVTLQGEGVSFSDCFGASGSVIEIPLTEQEGALIRGASSAVIPCTVAVDRAVWENKAQGTASIIFDLSYKYFVDSDATLTVIGRRR